MIHKTTITIAMLMWAIIVGLYIKNAENKFIDGTITSIGIIILVALLFEVMGLLKTPSQKQKWENCWNWISKEHDNNPTPQYSKMMQKWNVDFDTASDLYDLFQKKNRDEFAKLFKQESQYDKD